MDRTTQETDVQALLREMAAEQRRSRVFSWISTAAIVLLAAALIVSLVILVPQITDTLDRARVSLDDTQQIIQRLNSSLDTLDSIGENLEQLTGESTENLQKLLDSLGTLDLDALTESLQNLGSVLDLLGSFRLFG